MEHQDYTETELKFFRNVYNYLKVSMRSDLSGNISATDVQEFLFSASKLSHDKINQIGTITGANAQGWYAEKQLFQALKLVAAAQQGLPLSSSMPAMDLDLALPVLLTNNNIQLGKELIDLNDRNQASSPDLIQLSDSDGPLTKRDEGYQIMVSEDGGDETTDGTSTRYAMRNTNRSPSVSSPGSDSPTPTNSMHEKNWPKSSESQWQSLVNEEHRQLLGTEEDSSDRHSSDDNDDHYDEDNDLWVMTDEQKKYYLQQFLAIQPDANALIPGHTAKEFFEKSRLPTTELSKIWQLSDVTKDGALSLEEFNVAMHLVVLRRNHIRLPDFLPESLIPKSFKLNAQKSIESASSSSSTTNMSFNSESKASSIEQKAPTAKSDQAMEELVSISPTRGKEWAKFVDSPTSTLSSPGPKPCNFDFQRSAVEKDPKILHPKALRVTPEAKRMEEECRPPSQEHDTFPFDGRGHAFKSPLQKTPPVTLHESSQDRSLRVAKHTENKSISPNRNSIHRQEEDERLYGSSSLSAVGGHNKRDIPPPPPPRPSRTHMRSSSLDLNKAQKNLHPGNLPAVPPRTSPNTGSPQRQPPSSEQENNHWEHRLSDVSEDTSSGVANPSQTDNTRTSAFEVYKKPGTDNGISEFATPEIDKTGNHRGQDKRDILSSLHTMKEKNSVLLRVNSELNQELAEVIEERIALEFQLQQMKPFSN